MKKIFLIILILSIFLSNSIFVSASNSDLSIVSQALSAVNGKFEIPDNYTNFSNKIVYNNNLPYVYMSWYGDRENNIDGGKIDVIIDNNFKIISFKQYFYGNYVGNYKLSKINSLKAATISDEFLQKICPEYFEKVKRADCKNYYIQNFDNYTFNYIRYENNIPCYENYIEVQVNPYNYKVSSVVVNWDNISRIYTADANTQIDKAKVAMYDKIGFSKEYVKSDDGDFYVRYYNASDGRNYINAYTYEILDTKNYSHLLNFRNNYSINKNFNPQYLKTDENGIDYYADEYSTYVFENNVDKNNNQISCIKDINSGEIRFLSVNRKQLFVNKHLSLDQCKQIANKYFGNNLKSFTKECKLLNIFNDKDILGDEIYYFNYDRMINGISYDSNGAIIGVSSATGNVVSVITGWDVVNIDYSTNLIDSGTAYSKYIENVDFGLQYVISNNNNKKDFRLVYGTNPNIQLYIDASNGNLIDNNKTIVSDNVFVDILDNSYKDRILSMLSLNIIDSNEFFNPSDEIKLCDYLMLMFRTIEHSNYTSVNEVYNKFISMGIVTEEDIVNNGSITIKDAVKYLVSYLGYDELASLEDTYQVNYYDSGEIPNEYLGYSAIANGLKLIDGNYFMPNSILKRDYAVNLLFNLIRN